MDKRESAGIKALAIIMMFWHHLFGCDTFLSNGIVLDYIPIFKGYDAAIGIACKLCIALFAFSSGYGIQKSYIEKGKYNKIILSIYKFLLQYWIIMFFVAIPYLVYFDKFNIEYLPINLFAVLHNDEMLYVSLSWYVKVNLMFLCISPVIKFLSKRIKSIVTEIFIIVFPIIICNYLPDCESFYRTVSEGILSTIKLFCLWFPIFYTGVLFAKYKIIEKARSITKTAKTPYSVILSLFCLIGVLIIRNLLQQNIVLEIFCTIVFVFSFDYIYTNIISKLIILDKCFYFLGNYSFQFWLLSGMFFLNTTEFLWVLYLPKLSVLILIWNFIILIPFAFAVKKIHSYIFDYSLKFYRMIRKKQVK